MATNTATARNDSEVEDLRNEFASLKRDVAELTETLRKVSDEKAGESREKMREAARHSREKAGRAVHGVERSIETHPMTGVATAFGVGFIAGKLLNR